MEVEQRPLKDLAIDLTVSALDGLREIILTQEFLGADYRLFKGFLIEGLSYLESEQFMEDRKFQPITDVYLPKRE